MAPFCLQKGGLRRKIKMKTDKGYKKTRKSHNIPSHAHELTFSCYNNRQFLKYDITRGFFLDAIERAREKHNFDLWAYVIMPEHVHLLIWPGEKEYSIAKILQAIKLSTTKRAMKYLEMNKPEKLKWLSTGQASNPYRFWQDGGGYDRNVYSYEALVEMIEYIHRNPVRSGLVDDPLKWEWSSAREWVEPGSGPIRIDRESFPVIHKSR